MPALTSSGMPRSSPAAWVMPAITIVSTYSRMDGLIPLLTMWGTACATSASVPNGASTVDDAVKRG